ncbi:Glycosyltransferase, catalytic subunit of cellulose synthase and poly-beta-1,6-N-acetylglucosamine synthase [Halobiforma haloterrestris]|uniref:Glycosyltransferase, catalytic subunit of cellulose synthase and poly-beta-1,6-N-acetylglucosamine synthase n=1 Tax=Natronobacterium haloterrestre TaxID=148448 RepID=A0A1I1I0E0_NATHA|nr:glycosyltransferase family 2 protein [Halobiforma haloterrestris]SFC29495.1 Glycosyltransferase, catalytic subunit of cellulose synthase and poly-beta-1,6-N-acetylglucosamine synthase [Halobiforma haloterrestris]
MALALRSTVERAGYLSAVIAVLAFGAYEGVQREAISLDLHWLIVRVVTIDAVAATVVFSVLVTVSGVMLTYEVYGERDPDERVLDGPRVAAIVPAYQDANVIGESVETLLASNYRNLEIAIVGEPNDEPTVSAAREYARHPNVQVLINGDPGSKAGAINDAVERLDAEYFAAFDVDERIDPDFIPSAMYHLTEESVDVFQARRVPRVTGPVEALAYCERLLFHAGYKLVEPLGFTYCRSSSSAFTREAFETVNGLDELLTEDIDFAHKCFRADLSVRQSRNITNEMEAPHALGDLWGQRKRWRLGHIEVLFKAITGGYDRGGLRGKMSTLRIFSSLAASVFLVALAAKVLVLLVLDLELFFLLPFVAISLTIVPVLTHDVRQGHVAELTPALMLVPLVYPGFGLLTIRCAFEYFLSWDGEWYQVDKAGA